MKEKILRKKVVCVMVLAAMPWLSNWAVAAADAASVNARPAGVGLNKAMTAAAIKNATTQLNSISLEKNKRSEAEKKLSSGVLEMMKGPSAAVQSSSLKPMLRVSSRGMLVDIKADVSDKLLAKINNMGGKVVHSSDRYGAVRAWLSESAMQALSEESSVTNIRPADQAITHKVDTSEGVEAHRIDEVLSNFEVDGTGVTIAVLSDSVRGLEDRQQTGDLPDVEVLDGQDGIQANGGDSGEGTAMLEIVHDLAPGAKLMFATAFNGQASFAQNIIDLRAAGADIIVDDVFFFAEPAFQDGIIAQAVNTVVQDGALYFSSAGNSGNLNDGTSGTFEGDFKAINAFGAVVHDFGDGAGTVTVTADTGPVTLRWNDPDGASSNDYDLFAVRNGQVVAASTSVQDGNDSPFEIIGGQAAGTQLIIVQRDGAEDRVVHLSTNRGQLAIATESQISGHAAAELGIAVAAVNAAFAGGNAFVGGNGNPVEAFSSDGPRRVFFDANGNPLSNDLTSNGGEVRQVPQITAGDGVSTSQPGFSPFFGTSAAAPHAAAIAGVLLSARPDSSGDEITNAMFATALDIEEQDFDRDSGNGIIDSVAALELLCQDNDCVFQNAGDDNADNGDNADVGNDVNFFSNDTQVAIPDANRTGIRSVIDVTRSGDSGIITLTADITHTFRGDLQVVIIAPNGARATVVRPSNDSGDDISLSINVRGDGVESQGEWTLLVRDLFGKDTGTLNNWSLTFP